jgi:hypothetical protein
MRKYAMILIQKINLNGIQVADITKVAAIIVTATIIILYVYDRKTSDNIYQLGACKCCKTSYWGGQAHEKCFDLPARLHSCPSGYTLKQS